MSESEKLLNVEGGAGGICFDYRRTRNMTCMGKNLTYYPYYQLILTPTTSFYVANNRAWRLCAVPTFSETVSPVRSLCEFKRSAVARHSRPFPPLGCVRRPACTGIFVFAFSLFAAARANRSTASALACEMALFWFGSLPCRSFFGFWAIRNGFRPVCATNADPKPRAKTLKSSMTSRFPWCARRAILASNRFSMCAFDFGFFCAAAAWKCGAGPRIRSTGVHPDVAGVDRLHFGAFSPARRASEVPPALSVQHHRRSSMPFWSCFGAPACAPCNGGAFRSVCATSSSTIEAPNRSPAHIIVNHRGAKSVNSQRVGTGNRASSGIVGCFAFFFPVRVSTLWPEMVIFLLGA